MAARRTTAYCTLLSPFGEGKRAGTREPLARTIDDDDLSAAFWELTDDQVAVLRPYDKIIPTAAGQILFQQGDPTRDFYMVLEGEVHLVEPGGTPALIGTRRRNEIVGELNLLTPT